MPVEIADYIEQLNKDAPQGGESISEGDDHIRTIKRAVVQSFPKIDAPVTATPAELNAVSQMKVDLDALKSQPKGNAASCFWEPSGGMKYSHNVKEVIQTAGNSAGTRVVFDTPLSGVSPDHYAFSVTGVSGSLSPSPYPALLSVTNITRDHIDFLTLQYDGSDWAFSEGATTPFSLVVIDMEAGQ